MTGHRVDSHAHLWDRARFTYDWLDEEPGGLQRSFLLEDLTRHLAGTAIDEVVVVQADCRAVEALDEAAWLQELAGAGAPILAAVAHAPLEENCLEHLETLADLPLVTGVRRLLQSEAAGFATSDRFVAGVALLENFGFSLDLCIRQHQLAEAGELVRRSPGVRFVLDHVGKPVIDAGSFDAWAEALTAMAAAPNVSCKLSGLMSEAPEGMRDADSLSPWLDHALDVFGADRCMYGSDWPVLTTVSDGIVWRDIVASRLDEGSADELAAVFGGTAQRVYGGR